MDTHVCLLLLSHIILCIMHQVQGDMTDHCQGEFFKASCDAGHVIVVRKARYGRMNQGRCVRENFGYLGCTNDVRDVLDRKCSGRRLCNIRVLDEEFPAVQPCHADLKSFLQIEYTCERVITAPRHQCQSMQTVTTAVPTGLISSLIADETKCGTADAPWLIKVPQGQKVNITLLDFSTSSGENSSSTGVSGSNPGSGGSSASTQPQDGSGTEGTATVCRVYATIRETVNKRSVTICGGDVRERSVYVSLQSAVEIRIISSKTPHKNVHFLLKYEPIGCPDPTPPEAGWVKHKDNQAIYGCNGTEDNTWQWLCQGNQWTGENRNCSKASLSRNASHTEVLGFMSLPMGLSIVIIMALAFVVGVLVLAIGLVFLRRQRPARPSRPPDHYQDTALMLTDHTHNEIYVKHAITCNITSDAALMARRQQGGGGAGDVGNDYATMKLLGHHQQCHQGGGNNVQQHPPTSSSDTNSYDDGKQCVQQQQGSIDWLDQDIPPPPPPEYSADGDGGQGGEHRGGECCPELLRGHRGPGGTLPPNAAAIRYIVPPHQCQQCGGQKPTHPQQVQQVQTLGRYRQPTSGGQCPGDRDGGGDGCEGTTYNKPRRLVSFSSTLPTAKNNTSP